MLDGATSLAHVSWALVPALSCGHCRIGMVKKSPKRVPARINRDRNENGNKFGPYGDGGKVPI